MLRMALFMGTNLLVVFVLSGIVSIFFPGLGRSGIGMMVIMSAAIGMVGSFISLAMSKSSAKRAMGVQVIETPSNDTEKWLVETVRRQAEQAGIGMPEVGIFNDPSANAFATGMKKNDALVAVSTGLLQAMNKDEVEAVLGHEIAHVANGDMITMALMQGVVNTFVLVAARLLASFMGRNNRMGYYAGYYGGQLVFGFLATLLVKWFSRRREYRADTGGAGLASNAAMIGALEKLKGGSEPEMPEQMAAFGISGRFGGGFLKALTSTHPQLDDRIQALREAQAQS